MGKYILSIFLLLTSVHRYGSPNMVSRYGLELEVVIV